MPLRREGEATGAGRIPEVSLQLADNRGNDARRLLAAGTAPGQQKKDAAAAKAGLEEPTFGAIACDWMRGADLARVLPGESGSLDGEQRGALGRIAQLPTLRRRTSSQWPAA